jgi:hypothetical protein
MRHGESTVTVVEPDRRRRRWRLTAMTGLLVACAGTALLVWAFTSTAPHSAGAPPGGGGGDLTNDIATLISAVAGLVSATGGLVSAVVAWIALRRQGSAATAATGVPAADASERSRLWTPQDGPVSDERSRRGHR